MGVLLAKKVIIMTQYIIFIYGMRSGWFRIRTELLLLFVMYKPQSRV